MPVTLNFGVDEYTLSVDDDESDPAEYGDPVVIESGGSVYVALVEETDDGERVSLLDADGKDWVFKGKPVRCGFDEYDEVAEEVEEDDDDEPGDGIDSPTASIDVDDPETDDGDDDGDGSDDTDPDD